MSDKISKLLESIMASIEKKHAACSDDSCTHDKETDDEEMTDEQKEIIKKCRKLNNAIAALIVEYFGNSHSIKELHLLGSILGHVILRESESLLLLKLVEHTVLSNL